MCVSLWTGYSVNNLFQQAVAMKSSSKQLSFFSVAKLLNAHLLLSSLRDQVWVLNDLSSDIHIDKLFFLLGIVKSFHMVGSDL